MIAKDEEGNWTLGSVRTKDSKATTAFTTDSHDYTEEEDNEQEDACVICLDSFQVGDVVSWSRFSEDCHHVFHADCIQPWLERKRQDECPSCRFRLIVEEPLLDLEKGEELVSDTDSDEKPGTIGDQEHPNDYTDRDEDSFFVIVHGLIARAAKHATYTLIGTKDSMDEKEGMPSASPLRRVVSYEPTRSPPVVIVGGLRRQPRAVQHYPNLQSIAAVQSFDSEDDDDKETTKKEQLIAFRRVQSDVGSVSRQRTLHHIAQEKNDKLVASPQNEGDPIDDKMSALESLRLSGLILQNAQYVEEAEFVEMDEDSIHDETDDEEALTWIARRGATPSSEIFSSKDKDNDQV